MITRDERIYDLDMKEAEAAYESYLAGDETAIPRLLRNSSAVAATR